MTGSFGNRRLHSLDILRGVCALGVCIYHYCLWAGLDVGKQLQGVLGLVGTYGVSIFFVLSGYSLAFAYGRKFGAKIESGVLIGYFRRRIGRLGPLFMLTAVASVAGKFLLGKAVPNPLDLLLNFSLLFGFVDPANTPVIGGWSIGVELVFYLVFPVVMALGRGAWIMLAGSGLLAVWYAVALQHFPTLADGWRTYVAPANHAVFFIGGIVICHMAGSRIQAAGAKAVAVAVIAAFVLIAGSLGASELDLVTGWRRLLLTMFSLFFVAACAHIDVPARLRGLASILGSASYPIYLLHPLVYFVAKGRLESLPAVIGLAAVVAGLALVVDKYAEQPMQRRLKNSGW